MVEGSGTPGGGTRFLLVGLLGAWGLAGCSNTLPVRPVDYRLPPAVLAPVAAAGVADESEAFADLFCSVLEHVDDLADV